MDRNRQYWQHMIDTVGLPIQTNASHPRHNSQGVNGDQLSHAPPPQRDTTEHINPASSTDYDDDDENEFTEVTPESVGKQANESKTAHKRIPKRRKRKNADDFSDADVPGASVNAAADPWAVPESLIDDVCDGDEMPPGFQLEVPPTRPTKNDVKFENAISNGATHVCASCHELLFGPI